MDSYTATFKPLNSFCHKKEKKDKNRFRTWSDITVLTFFSLFINPHGLPMMRFGMTWDWVNDGTIFSCLRETPLKAHWVITHWTICIIYDNCLKKEKKKEILKTGLFKLESRDPLDSGDFTNPVLCTSTYIFKTKKIHSHSYRPTYFIPFHTILIIGHIIN